MHALVGCSEILDLRLQLPPSHVYCDANVVTRLEYMIPCTDGKTRSLSQGVFLCAPEHHLFDARFTCKPVHPATKSISVWVQTRHSRLQSAKQQKVTSPELCRWYKDAIASLAAYAEHDEVVIVFITNQRYKPKTTVYNDLFKHCPRLLLLAADQSGSLSNFLGKTFGHRGLLAQQEN